MFDVFEKNNRNFIVHTVSLFIFFRRHQSFLKRQISTHLSLSTNLSTHVPPDSPFRLLSLYRTNFEIPLMLHRH